MFLPETLDFIFPFIVLFYGALLTFVLGSERLMKLAEENFPTDLVQRMKFHRGLAFLCLIVGSLWSLQNIWS